jgi:hypothetical protein
MIGVAPGMVVVALDILRMAVSLEEESVAVREDLYFETQIIKNLLALVGGAG